MSTSAPASTSTSIDLVKIHECAGLATRAFVAGVAADTYIHGWDIARATGQDSTLDPELLDVMYAMFKPQAAMLQASGAFAPPVDVPVDCDTQTLLLAMLGRDNRP